MAPGLSYKGPHTTTSLLTDRLAPRPVDHDQSPEAEKILFASFACTFGETFEVTDNGDSWFDVHVFSFLSVDTHLRDALICVT